MRIAIVNDRPLAVEAISRVLRGAPGYSVAWVASTGREAVQRCQQDRPDLVLMDLFMPEMDGVAATAEIMASAPCPVLIVTASVQSNAGKVFQALSAGAIDAVKTPVLGLGNEKDYSHALLSKIHNIRLLVTTPENAKKGAKSAGDLGSAGTPECLIAIAASAGGPAAIAMVLAGLPSNFNGAVVIVQHVDAQFAPLLASWLQDQSHLPVRLAQEGEAPQPGVILLAAGKDHLVLNPNNRFGYVVEPASVAYRPSADVLFDSIARHWKGNVAGVVLTGMGRDGAAGLKQLRDRNALTIAQHKDSCVVFGMPKAAIQLNAASEVLPLEKIAQRLVQYTWDCEQTRSPR